MGSNQPGHRGHSGLGFPINIEIEKAGTLKEIISTYDAKSLKSLKILGEMNAVDFWYIRDNFSALSYLNLEDVSIMEVEASDNRFLGTKGIQPANSIPEWALTSLSKLESVVLPTSTKALLDNSLSSMNLRLIEIPEKVENIGLNVFYGNQNLEGVILLNPNPVMISDCVFNETSCPSSGYLYVPEGTIEKYREAPVWKDFKTIFEGRISTIIRHDVVIDDLIYDCIGPNATITGYKGNPINVIVPEKIVLEDSEFIVTSIQDRAFQDCLSLESFEMPNTITSIGTDNIYLGYVFLYCSNLKYVKLSENLTRIPAGTFLNCTQLEECDIPESIELIGMQAFYNTGLKNIYIPKKAKPEIMGFGAFAYNTKLTAYSVHPENQYYKAIDGVLYRTDGENFILESIPDLIEGTLNVVDQCTIVDSYSIGNSIKTVIFNDLLQSIKEYAANGSGLKHVVLPPNATIYPNSFWYCTNLESITVTGNTFNNEDIFVGCNDLTNIYLCNAKGNIDFNKKFVNGSNTLNFYSPSINPTFAYEGNGICWIPGATFGNYNNSANLILSEMWSYGIDRALNMILVKPANKDIIIDNVLVNGELVTSNDKHLYSISTTDNLDVVVNYTLHGRQSMSTHYTQEFNAALESGIFITGDVDGNGDVDGMDLNVMISGVVSPETSTLTPATADMNGDGVIDGLDLNTLITNIINNQK